MAIFVVSTTLADRVDRLAFGCSVELKAVATSRVSDGADARPRPTIQSRRPARITYVSLATVVPDDGLVDAGSLVVEPEEIERGVMRIIDYLDDDGLVLTERAYPVAASGIVGYSREGVAGRLSGVGRRGVCGVLTDERG